MTPLALAWAQRLLVEPFVTYGFLRAGLLAAVVVGATCAVLSCLLVVRGQALLGDAISHAVLLGVVVGFLVGGDVGILVGAMAVAVLAGSAITALTRHAPFQADTSMGIVFTVLFALGLAIISIAQPRGIDLFHVLFGNVLGVRAADLWLTTVSGALVIGTVLIGLRAFELWSFDPKLASAMGMRVGRLEQAFTALLSVAVVASLQTVGLILVVAMLIIPGATAALLARRLRTMLAVAVAAGVTAGVVGLYGSFHLDVASGPSIVLVAGALFGVALVAGPRGLVATAFARPRADGPSDRATDGPSDGPSDRATDHVPSQEGAP